MFVSQDLNFCRESLGFRARVLGNSKHPEPPKPSKALKPQNPKPSAAAVAAGVTGSACANHRGTGFLGLGFCFVLNLASVASSELGLRVEG